MKVILKGRVENLGEMGEEVDVSAGHARNFLLPRDLAEEATPGARKRLAHLVRRAAAVRAEAEAKARARAATLEGIQIQIRARITEEGGLYGSVGATEIAAALAAQGHQVERREVETSGPIRTLGAHEVRINLGTGIRVPLRLEVLPLEEAAPITSPPAAAAPRDAAIASPAASSSPTSTPD